jgi:hypothetical protein
MGSYGRASRRAALAILKHFEAHQEALLERLISDPDLYCKVLARVLPRQVRVDVSDPASWDYDQAAFATSAAIAALNTAGGDWQGAMVRLERILDGHECGPAAVNNGD